MASQKAVLCIFSEETWHVASPDINPGSEPGTLWFLSKHHVMYSLVVQQSETLAADVKGRMCMCQVDTRNQPKAEFCSVVVLGYGYLPSGPLKMLTVA